MALNSGGGELTYCRKMRFVLVPPIGENLASLDPAPQGNSPKSARIGPERAPCRGSRDVERGDRNRRPPAPGQQYLAIRRERPEPRLAIGAISETCRRRIEEQPHVADAERLVGPLEEQLNLWPLDPPIKPDPQRAILRLCPARFDQECPVLAPDAPPRQPELGRIELEVGEMENAVIAPRKIGGQPRQPAGQPGKECIVEPPDPRLGLADDARPFAARPGTTCRWVWMSTMPRPGIK